MIVQIATPMLELWRIDGEFSNHPHAHDAEYQITVPVRGDCQFTLENKQYLLHDGAALVQHPGERHFFEARTLSGLIIFKIRREGMGGSHPGSEAEWAVKQQFDPMQLMQYFRIWTDTLMRSDPYDRLIQEQTESQVIEYVTSVMTGTGSLSLSHPSSLAAATHKDVHLRQVLDYIHSHYREELSVDMLAGIAAQSRYHFIRYFKSATGETPYQYVLKLRMKEAMHRLRTSHASVIDIALSLGYSSASPFYRAFAKTYGVHPEQCRGK
ncbi:helix-turn-helix domain-containing protein [Paenibacillus chartarius]|uniref:Helix-turn-helix domain-containing protein n=1 Tax=Paenibacillus chartarius TaxID=747481 RepID=A0ABV6DGF4_9BACL